VLARDIAVTALEIDDRALPARLGNGADFHVLSGTRFLRCWFPRPQLGGCLNPGKTRTSDASGINCYQVKHQSGLKVPTPRRGGRDISPKCPLLAGSRRLGEASLPNLTLPWVKRRASALNRNHAMQPQMDTDKH
jgi:hypothetical protein